MDGDGNIFGLEYLTKGHPGGFSAATELVKGIHDYMLRRQSLAPSEYDITIYVFWNKQGLAKILANNGYLSHAEKNKATDDFTAGFNQAGHRFLMVDVGPGKEAADAKMKGAPFSRFPSVTALIEMC